MKSLPSVHVKRGGCFDERKLARKNKQILKVNGSIKRTEIDFKQRKMRTLEFFGVGFSKTIPDLDFWEEKDRKRSKKCDRRTSDRYTRWSTALSIGVDRVSDERTWRPNLGRLRENKRSKRVFFLGEANFVFFFSKFSAFYRSPNDVVLKGCFNTQNGIVLLDPIRLAPTQQEDPVFLKMGYYPVDPFTFFNFNN